MYYLLLILQIAITTYALVWRTKKYKARKLQINPKGHPEDSHNMIKSGKTKALQRVRQKYRNHFALILAMGLAAITFTLLYNANEIVNQHRADGLLQNL